MSRKITQQSVAYVKELSVAMQSCSTALASELDKYEMTTSTPEDISARYWLMNFLEPLNKKELKSIVDAFLIPLLVDEEQAKKIVKFLLVRFPDYYKEYTEPKVQPAPEPVQEKIPVPEFVKDELEKSEESTAAKHSILKYNDLLIINPEESDSYNNKELKNQILKEIKNYNVSLVSVKIAEDGELTEDGEIDVVVILKGDKEELKKFFKKSRNNPGNIINPDEFDKEWVEEYNNNYP